MIAFYMKCFKTYISDRYRGYESYKAVIRSEYNVDKEKDHIEYQTHRGH